MNTYSHTLTIDASTNLATVVDIVDEHLWEALGNDLPALISFHTNSPLAHLLGAGIIIATAKHNTDYLRDELDVMIHTCAVFVCTDRTTATTTLMFTPRQTQEVAESD